MRRLFMLMVLLAALTSGCGQKDSPAPAVLETKTPRKTTLEVKMNLAEVAWTITVENEDPKRAMLDLSGIMKVITKAERGAEQEQE